MAVATGSTATSPATMGARESRVVWLLLAAAFVAILNETTMGVALKVLNDDLGVDEVQGQWLTTAFLLTMAVVIPTTGFILQRFTTRHVFVAAMSLFSAGTALALVAPTFEILVTARVVQASGTAIMMPLLMTTLMQVVPPSQRGRIMSRVSMVISLAPAIGPTLSGVLIDTIHWRATFGVVLPIAIASLLMGAKWITNLNEPKPAPLDVLSIVLSALGFGGLVYGLSQIGAAAHGGTDGSAGNSTPLIVALSLGLLGLVIFVLRQLHLQKIERALLDLRVFRSGNFSLSVAMLAVISLAFFGVITVLPLFMQNTLLMSATEAGTAILPGSLVMAFIAPIIGRVYDRRGTRPLLIPGSLLIVGCLWFFTTFDENTTWLTIMLAQTIMCVGLAMSFTPLFTASLGSLTPSLYSHGSATVSTIQQVAGAAGIAVLVTVMSTVRDAEMSAGASAAVAGAAGTHVTFIIAAFLAMPFIVGAIFIRKPADSIGEDAPVAH